jgi:hypothetical protein
MVAPLNAAQFAAILSSSGLSDACLAKLFRVNQSTVSRLRHAKIRKIAKYLGTLQESGKLPAQQDQRLAVLLAELGELAQGAPALRALLQNLHTIMHQLPALAPTATDSDTQALGSEDQTKLAPQGP